MKDTKIGDYILWQDKPAKIIGECDKRQVIIEMLEKRICPNCGESLGVEQFQVVVASPLFQENANRLPTLIDDDKLILS
jgi:hypothetical protein